MKPAHLKQRKTLLKPFKIFYWNPIKLPLPKLTPLTKPPLLLLILLTLFFFTVTITNPIFNQPPITNIPDNSNLNFNNSNNSSNSNELDNNSNKPPAQTYSSVVKPKSKPTYD